MKKYFSGITMIELLVALALMSVVMAGLMQSMGGTLRGSNLATSRAEMLADAQLAQQIISSYGKEAVHIFPTGTSISMGTSWATQKPVGGNAWTVGTDPIIAMVLPPNPSDALPNQYRFYAYYPVLQNSYRANAIASQNSGGAGSDQVWVLMQYKGYFGTGVTSAAAAIAASSSAANYTNNGAASLLVDDVQPQTDPTPDVNYNYTIFNFDQTNQRITFNLRMQRSGIRTASTTLGTNNIALPLSININPRNN